jgi:hypothetical protein
MTDRIQRHAQMGEEYWHMTMDCVTAHLQGRRPLSPWLPRSADSVVAFAQTGDIPLGEGDENKIMQLKELQMFWQKIPDFGPKSFKLVPDENGWGVFLYWGGTDETGKKYLYYEADRVTTDANFDVTRYEIHCDLAEWMRLAAFVNDADPDTFTIQDYLKAIQGMPG